MKVSKDHFPAAWIRAGAIPASTRAVALPAHIDWPSMDLGKNACSWVMNQEQVGMVPSLCSQSSECAWKFRSIRYRWKVQILFLKSSRLSGWFPSWKKASPLWVGKNDIVIVTLVKWQNTFILSGTFQALLPFPQVNRYPETEFPSWTSPPSQTTLNHLPLPLTPPSRLKWKLAPLFLPFPVVLPGRTKLWHLWLGTPHNNSWV